MGRRGLLKWIGGGAAALTATQLGGCDDDDTLPEDGIVWDEETDIVIMGGGGAGLTAAIVAREAGAEVIVIEKAEAVGGTTALSGGIVQASASGPQGAVGMVMGDTAAQHAEYWYQASEGAADRAMLEWLASESAASIEFMESHGMEYVGVSGVSHMPQVEEGLMVPRIHSPGPSDSASGGARHVEVLRQAAEGLGTDLRVGARVDRLILREQAVVGVRATIAGETRNLRARKAVILASGPFSHNREMSRAFSPQQLWELETGVCYCAPTNVGDGIRLGMAAGGELASGLSATIGYPAAVMGSREEIGGIWVNIYGQRFVAEDSHYSHAIRRVYQQQGSLAWAIFDQETAALGGTALGGLFGRWSEDLSAELANGTLVRADTLEALAAALGAHGPQLAATVAMWNQEVEGGGEDSLFGRRVALRPIGDGPYYAVRITSVNLGSCGGLRINTDAQVLDDRGEAIPGLYAAGMVTGGFIGTFYPGSGTAIAITLATGRSAGAHAAARTPAA